MGAQFFCRGAGGPQRDEGRALRTAHAGMNISEQELIATIDDFVAAMQGQGVGATEVRSMPSSSGQATAMSAALLARSGPPATAVPITPKPGSPITVFTSSKSTLTRPGMWMMSPLL